MTTEYPLEPGDRVYLWQRNVYAHVLRVHGDTVTTTDGVIHYRHLRYEPDVDTIYSTGWLIRQESIEAMQDKDDQARNPWACIDPTVLFILSKMGLDSSATAKDVRDYQGPLNSELFTESELTTIDNHGYLCIVKQAVDKDRVIAEINAAEVNGLMSTNVPLVAAVAMEESRARNQHNQGESGE